jgi:hypothetical protein
VAAAGFFCAVVVAVAMGAGFTVGFLGAGITTWGPVLAGVLISGVMPLVVWRSVGGRLDGFAALSSSVAASSAAVAGTSGGGVGCFSAVEVMLGLGVGVVVGSGGCFLESVGDWSYILAAGNNCKLPNRKVEVTMAFCKRLK